MRVQKVRRDVLFHDIASGIIQIALGKIVRRPRLNVRSLWLDHPCRSMLPSVFGFRQAASKLEVLEVTTPTMLRSRIICPNKVIGHIARLKVCCFRPYGLL